MKKEIVIYLNGVNHHFHVLNCSDFDRVEIPNVVIIDIYKWHNHSYSFKAFFYRAKVIVSSEYYSTIKELFCAIQFRLQQYLFNVEQFG